MMLSQFLRTWRRNPEAAGFLMSVLFVCLAATRDVYLGGLFQRLDPLVVAVIGFSLCTVVFLPLAHARHPESLRLLFRRPWSLFWVNATSAVAWIAFFYALRMIEPTLVQILHSGIGPLSIVWIERFFPGTVAPAPLARAEGYVHLGLLASLIFTAGITAGGFSGAGPQPLGVAALGVVLAAGSGVSISVNTRLCRTLNDHGVNPTALVALRFPGAVILAAGLAAMWGHHLVPLGAVTVLAFIFLPSLLLIVLPIYVNQVGISLASPLTVRVVLATTPVLIFFLQILEGRLSPSPYSFTAAVLYAFSALSAALARQRAIRSSVPG